MTEQPIDDDDMPAEVDFSKGSAASITSCLTRESFFPLPSSEASGNISLQKRRGTASICRNFSPTFSNETLKSTKR